MFSLVAGHLEGGETGREAMVREAAEEIGILLKDSDLQFVHISHRLGNTPEEERVDIFYSVHWQDDAQNLEPEKCSELSWGNPKGLPEDIIPFIALVVEDIEQGILYSEYKTDPRFIIET